MLLKVLSSKENSMMIAIVGRIDTTNAPMLEKEFNSVYEAGKAVVFDVKDLEYLASSGLRFFLKVKKNGVDFEIVNASADVYDIFDMTGFTEMFTVRRAYRQVSVEGCKVIGQGCNGKVYRLDDEMILKQYLKPDCMDDIVSEKEHAKHAFLMGIPTAISFDIVQVGETYGSIFELIDAKSLKDLMIENPEKMDEYAQTYVDLLKVAHAIHDPKRSDFVMPDALKKFRSWLDFVAPHLPAETNDLLKKFADSIPENDVVLHGDCQPNNVMITRDGPLFIDMDTLTTGDPMFELGFLFATVAGYVECRPTNNKLVFPPHLRRPMWQKVFDLYYADKTEAERERIAAGCRVIAATQIFRNSIKNRASLGEGDYERSEAFVKSALADWAKLN